MNVIIIINNILIYRLHVAYVKLQHFNTFFVDNSISMFLIKLKIQQLLQGH